jgi:hypothetical protein
MAADDQREFIDFYGYYTYDWAETFGSFSNHHYLLEQDYVSDGCSTLDSSEASITHEFLYPHHIKKTYYIEGVVKGNIVLAASGCTSTVTSYRVTICKTYEGAAFPDAELATTGWITVNDTLTWDAGLSIGDEMVYPFWINVWEEQKITEHERLFLRIEVQCDACTHLMHSNDNTWKDVWITIPFRL